MNLKYFFLSTVGVLLFLLAVIPRSAVAVDLIVETNPPAGSDHYSTIQAAINYADNILSLPTNTLTFRVIVQPGTYSGNVTPISNVPIIGTETARTIVTGSTNGTMFTINNATNITIRNLTIINSSTGISIANSSQITISNNVFQTGTANSAVLVQNSPTTSIINNTFYQNGTAINTSSDILITNNIFSHNGTAISGQITMTQVTYNDYNVNTSNGVTLDNHSIPNTTTTSMSDPLFVDTAQRDFHLRESSPCHSYSGTDAGNPAYPNAVDNTTFDIGAYGGPNADTIPYPVTGITVVPSATDSATVSWSPNNSYVITNSDASFRGGYNVYYNLSKAGPPYDNKVTLASTVTSTVISGLTTSIAQPAAPVLNEPGYSDQTLTLSWSPVPTATSYTIYYTDMVTSVTNTIGDVKTTTYTLGGLVNGRDYSIAVSAVAQPVYHFSVTAFDYTVVAAGGGTPGQAHESAHTNPEVTLVVGSPAESLLSNSWTAFPERLVPYPDLPNEGCFIATAAYGHYSAPSVRALRRFRDQYLLTNRPGRAFVRWYYRYGPIGARFINVHTWLKPVVRVALLPLVGLALFLTRVPILIKLLVVCCFVVITSYVVWYRKNRSRCGGVS